MFTFADTPVKFLGLLLLFWIVCRLATRRLCVEPVSYTHLTLPTNREV